MDEACTLDLIKRSPGDPEGIACVVVCHDEMERLPGFLKFYRSHGVREFWFIDNGSTDGTFEFLRDQPDVTLFRTPASYGNNRKGLRWSRRICDEFLRDRWVLTVDVDELLIWPGYGTVSLSQFLTYLKASKFRIVFAQMVDFFPRKGEWPRFDSNDDFLVTAPCFDYKGYTASPARHFPYIQIRGGIRQRIITDDTEAPILQKMPLVRWTKQAYYLKSVHYYSKMVPMCDCVCAIAHFKFSGSSASKFQTEIDRGQRWQGGDQYRLYQQAVEQQDAFYAYEGIAEIQSFAELADYGFLRCSAPYFRYLRKKQATVIPNVGKILTKPLSLKQIASYWGIVTRANSAQARNFCLPEFQYDLRGVRLDFEPAGGLLGYLRKLWFGLLNLRHTVWGIVVAIGKITPQRS